MDNKLDKCCNKIPEMFNTTIGALKIVQICCSNKECCSLALESGYRLTEVIKMTVNSWNIDKRKYCKKKINADLLILKLKEKNNG